MENGATTPNPSSDQSEGPVFQGGTCSTNICVEARLHMTRFLIRKVSKSNFICSFTGFVTVEVVKGDFMPNLDVGGLPHCYVLAKWLKNENGVDDKF